MSEFSHLDSNGKAQMVDISAKESTSRTAVAMGEIILGDLIYDALYHGESNPKGDVLGAARIAGIMSAKKTSELIPLCHPLNISKITLEFEFIEAKKAVKVYSTVKTNGATGVEMEALTATSVALLTIYDMCKALGKEMVIGNICLLEKSGGKSGLYRKNEEK